VSAQLSISSEQHRTYNYVVDQIGFVNFVTPSSFRSRPIDLAVRYRVLNDPRWQPYRGLGAHYVRAPNVDSEFGYQSHLGPEIVEHRISTRRSLGIVLDGKLRWDNAKTMTQRSKRRSASPGVWSGLHAGR
jgi:hypothetical protein